MFIIAGLGNPGEEYDNTRHNTGRIVLEAVRKNLEGSEWKNDKKYKALTSDAKLGKEKVLLVEPETFMNKSGLSLTGLITSNKKAESLIVIHDDLDLAIGTIKISWNRGSGGHRGVESVIRSIKTEAFIRIRIGISAATPKGVVKKVHGDKEVGDFILAKFKKNEEVLLKKAALRAAEAVAVIIQDGREKAMGEFNR